jgi:hypothetical protein
LRNVGGGACSGHRSWHSSVNGNHARFRLSGEAKAAHQSQQDSNECTCVRWSRSDRLHVRVLQY